MTINKELELVEKALRHRNRVVEKCQLVAKRLIKLGEKELGYGVLSGCLNHDFSKFYPEIRHSLVLGKHKKNSLNFNKSLKLHYSYEPHHPESWQEENGVMRWMDFINSPHFIEFAMDCATRSEENGTSFLDWLEEVATQKWKFAKNSDVWYKIIYYYNLSLDRF